MKMQILKRIQYFRKWEKKVANDGSAVKLMSADKKRPSFFCSSSSKSYVLKQFVWKVKSQWRQQALRLQRSSSTKQFSYDFHSYSLNFDDGFSRQHILLNSSTRWTCLNIYKEGFNHFIWIFCLLSVVNPGHLNFLPLICKIQNKLWRNLEKEAIWFGPSTIRRYYFYCPHIRCQKDEKISTIHCLFSLYCQCRNQGKTSIICLGDPRHQLENHRFLFFSD